MLVNFNIPIGDYLDLDSDGGSDFVIILSYKDGRPVRLIFHIEPYTGKYGCTRFRWRREC